MENPGFAYDEQNPVEELPIDSAEQLEDGEPDELVEKPEEAIVEAPAAKTAKQLAEERKAASLRGQLRRLTSLAAFGVAALGGGSQSAEAKKLSAPITDEHKESILEEERGRLDQWDLDALRVKSERGAIAAFGLAGGADLSTLEKETDKTYIDLNEKRLEKNYLQDQRERIAANKKELEDRTNEYLAKVPVGWTAEAGYPDIVKPADMERMVHARRGSAEERIYNMAYSVHDLGMVNEQGESLELGKPEKLNAPGEEKERYGLYFGGKHFADVEASGRAFADGEMEKAIAEITKDLPTVEYGNYDTVGRIRDWNVQFSSKGITVGRLLTKKTIPMTGSVKKIRFSEYHYYQTPDGREIAKSSNPKKDKVIVGLLVEVVRNDGSREEVKIEDKKEVGRERFAAPEVDGIEVANKN